MKTRRKGANKTGAAGATWLWEPIPASESGGFISAMRRLARGLEGTWRDLGGFGRTALVAIVLAALLAVGLGYAIQRASRANLLAARAEILGGVATDLGAAAVVERLSTDPDLYASFDSDVRFRLLGGETVRVKLWTAEGTIVYSDEPALVGQQFVLEDHARDALAGRPGYEMASVTGAENLYERGLGELIEFYLPVTSDTGEVVGIFEVYQTSALLQQSLADIRTDVWVVIGIGLGVLIMFVGWLVFSNARSLAAKRREAERLAGSLMQARAEERRRVVRALHDDVGQSLYRVLFGLRGSRDRIADPEIADELDRLAGLVRGVEGTLRSELRILNSADVDEVGLVSSIVELVEQTRTETGLDLELEIAEVADVSPGVQAAVYRAVQEGLFNVRKHAAAAWVKVQVSTKRSRIVIEVADDGRGWNGAEGTGLVSTRRELQAVGGGLSVRRRPRGGTVLRAWAPRAVPA